MVQELNAFIISGLLQAMAIVVLDKIKNSKINVEANRQPVQRL